MSDGASGLGAWPGRGAWAPVARGGLGAWARPGRPEARATGASGLAWKGWPVGLGVAGRGQARGRAALARLARGASGGGTPAPGLAAARAM